MMHGLCRGLQSPGSGCCCCCCCNSTCTKPFGLPRCPPPAHLTSAVLQVEAEPRQWLLPLLRQHVHGASLSFWAASLLPLARALGDRAATAAEADQLLALQCQSLEAQLWDTLPAFVDGAIDLADAFRCCLSAEP